MWIGVRESNNDYVDEKGHDLAGTYYRIDVKFGRGRMQLVYSGQVDGILRCAIAVDIRG